MKSISKRKTSKVTFKQHRKHREPAREEKNIVREEIKKASP